MLGTNCNHPAHALDKWELAVYLVGSPGTELEFAL